MTPDCTKYALRIYVDVDEPENGEGGGFSLSVHMRKRGRRPSPGQPLREQGDPVILQCARGLIESFAGYALTAGYVVRVDVSKATARESPWPRWCTALPQFIGLVGSLLSGPADPEDLEAYPISLWFIPVGSSDAEEAVETFRALPMEDQLFSDVLDNGVFRIALFDAFFDLLASPSLEGQVTDWMRMAQQAHGDIHVYWDEGTQS